MNRDTSVGVVGLGYVGLPLAVHAAQKGFCVTGFDLKRELLELIQRRESPFANDSRFAAALQQVDDEAFTVTSDSSKLSQLDVVVICVPTPTDDNEPDLGYVKAAAQEIATHLQPGQLIILESTVHPGVTREEVLPILERASGLRCGTDFYLAHCPERIDPGNPTYHVGNLNRVVGGITEQCTQKAVLFYQSVVDADIVPLASPEEAEFVKSWENTHRNVMIALANEAAVICDALGMDIQRVLQGLQSKVDQFGLRLAQPGIGPGGHCIPEDIHYVIRKARLNGIDTRFLDSAAELNDRMPLYAVNKLQKMVGGPKNLRHLKVAVLGLAYKENIEDARRSPSVEVAHLLLRRAGALIAHDPYVDPDDPAIIGIPCTNSLEEALDGADAVFVATAHDVYSQTVTRELLAKYGIAYVLDGRNCLSALATAQGAIRYKGIGR